MAEQFEQREIEIFRILGKLGGIKKIILIGGYALNSYVEFPRFSIDCDLMVYDERRAVKILKAEGYKLIERGEDFIRLERETGGVKTGIDLLIKKIIDRQSGLTFEFDDIFKGSAERELPAKSVPKFKTKFRIASPEVIFVIKFASMRKQDVRDIFILSACSLNKNKIRELIKKYFSDELLKERIEKLKESIESENFLNSLEGVYGKLPEEFISKTKKRMLNFAS